METISSRNLRRLIRDKLSPIYRDTEADQISALILEHHFGLSSTKQLIDHDLPMSDNIKAQIEHMVQRLLGHEPIQYVLGYTDFYGFQFKSDSRALIPRPETEELIQLLLNSGLSDTSSVLDIGTGTGCIAITLALLSEAKVYALDVEQAALNLAQENADRLGANVHFVLADILTEQPKLPKFEILVSNPPYVPDRDLDSLEPRVKYHEPASALFVPDDDPLQFYKRIAQLAPRYLKPGGKIFLEIYHTAGLAIAQLFLGPQWSQASLKKDLSGRDRIFTVCYAG
jgi:release factor glutamine methyltransferase